MLRLVQAQDKYIRRAIFVVDTQTDDLKVIDRAAFARNLFGRKLWRPLDECGSRGNLVDTADKALRTVFASDIFELERRGMFQVRGLSHQPVEYTVFLVSTKFQAVLRSVKPEHYLSLENHQFAGEITQLLRNESPAVRKRLGLG